MTERKNDLLVKKYTVLFKDSAPNRRHSFWIECGDGWFDILDDLCMKLEACIVALPPSLDCIECNLPAGRHPVLDAKGDAICDKFAPYRPHAVQVKEKFGGLRFYMSSQTPEMSDLIKKAEAQSFVTCEDCGQPGVLRGGRRGWLFTSCDAHAGKDSHVYAEKEKE